MKKLMMAVVGLMLMTGGYSFAEGMKKCDTCGMMDCRMDHNKGMGMHGKGMKEGKMMGQMDEECRFASKALKMKKELNLSKQQEESLEKIASDFKKLAIQKKADIKIVNVDLMDSMKNETPDFAAMKEKSKKVSDMKAALKLSMIEAHEQAFNVLTKEQQQKLASMKEDMHKERKGKMMDHKNMGK